MSKNKAVKSIENEAKAKLEAMAKQPNDRGLAAAVVLQEMKKAEETKGEVVTETKTKTKETMKKAKDFTTWTEWCDYRIERLRTRADESIAKIERSKSIRAAKADPKEAIRQKIAKLNAKLAELSKA